MTDWLHLDGKMPKVLQRGLECPKCHSKLTFTTEEQDDEGVKFENFNCIDCDYEVNLRWLS